MLKGVNGGGSQKWRGGFFRAFSLPEILVVIAVVAVMAAIGISMMAGVFKGSSYQMAERNLNLLNGAVVAFNEGNWELVWPVDGGSSDELAVFESLRYRAPSNPTPGSPYLPPNATFVASSNSLTHRASWNGRMYELIPEGSNGTGLDLLQIMGAPQAPSTNTPIPRSTN
jgi:prepilin-type N-terminal cleavage/methylation domain-containing protein